MVSCTRSSARSRLPVSEMANARRLGTTTGIASRSSAFETPSGRESGLPAPALSPPGLAPADGRGVVHRPLVEEVFDRGGRRPFRVVFMSRPWYAAGRSFNQPRYRRARMRLPVAADGARPGQPSQHARQHAVGRPVAVQEGLDVDDDLLAHVDAPF